MLIEWFNSREAVEVGTSLADYFTPSATDTKPAGSRAGSKPAGGRRDVDRFLQRAAREVRPLKLNLFKRAKLLNSFKWRLLEHGCDQTTIEELTHLLLLQISGNPDLAPRIGGRAAGPSERESSKRIPALIAEADARFAEGKNIETVELLQQVLAISPRQFLVHTNLGAALSNLGRYGEAEQAFRRAIEIKPACAEAQINLGNLLQLKGEFAASETALRRAVKADPNNPEGLVCLGLTLGVRLEMDEAKNCFERALRLQPRNASALCALGWVASVEGRFEEAEKLFRETLEIDPRKTAAWAWLAGLRRMTATDKGWLEGVERTLASGLPPLEEARLRFAMGKYFDDLGKFPRAFEAYKRANDLHKLIASPYDRPSRVQFVDDAIRVCTRQRLTQSREGASESERPVFVTGMMRSGTSLVEQIIASHPDAAGAGELHFWIDAARRHAESLRSELPDGPLTGRLAESYLKLLSRHSTDALRVVDKSTFNSDHLGLIHSVFPQARIIYLQRDPVDTCLSCYFQDFANAASFTMDLADLAHNYREHRRLVTHWRSVLPAGAFLDVPYAELVAEPEVWSRKIIEFIGLPWDPRCLEFHKTERAVVTASNWQVRQAIYSRSVDRWRNYEKFIGPLLELRKLAP